MNKFASKILCAFALSVSAFAAHAATVQSSSVAMRFDDDAFALESQQGNSFTFASLAGGLYVPGASAMQYAMDFSARPGYALTGKMNVQLNATYQLDNDVGAAAFIDLSFDVLLPHCDRCGPYDSQLISTSESYVGSSADLSGSLYVDAGSTPASGSYGRLIVFVVDSPQLWDGYGSINVKDITFTAETVALSAVPELPPFAMLAAGLALIGAGVRRKRMKAINGLPA